VRGARIPVVRPGPGRYAPSPLVAGKPGGNAGGLARTSVQAMIGWATPPPAGDACGLSRTTPSPRAALAACRLRGVLRLRHVHHPSGHVPFPFPARRLWTALDLIDAAVHTGRDDEAPGSRPKGRAPSGPWPACRHGSPLVTAAARGDGSGSDDEGTGPCSAQRWPLPGNRGSGRSSSARVGNSRHGERFAAASARTRDARSQLARRSRRPSSGSGARPWARTRGPPSSGRPGATRQRCQRAAARPLTLQEREGPPGLPRPA